MTITAQIVPFEQVFGLDGLPLDNGKIYIGTVNQDPQNNQQPVYWDAAGTIPAAQPIRTVAGYISYNGSPARLYVNGNYSLKVLTKNDVQVYYVPDTLMIGSQSALTPITGVSQIATYALLRVYDGAATLVYVAGRTNDQDGAGGFWALDESDTTSADNDGTIIVTPVGRFKRQYNGVIRPEWFGAVGDSVTDDTTAVQKAHDVARQLGQTVEWSKNYAVQQLLLDGASGIRLSGRGSIVGIATTAKGSLLNIKNVLNVAVDGALFVNCNYNTNYECAVRMYTDAVGQQAAYIDITNLTPVNAKQAYIFGSESRPDDLVSEINIRGGHTFGCPSVVLAIGAQTVVNFTGSTLASLVGNGNAAWQALPQKTVVARGATVTINGGELLHTQLSTGGSTAQFNTTCEIQPVASVGSGNIWGNINVSGALVETACRLATSFNIGGLAAPTAGLIKFTGCHGVHTQDTAAFVETESTFNGRVQFKANNFFCTTPRTQQNMIIGGATCEVYCDKESFGKNFKPYLGGITGGLINFEHQLVFRGNGLNQSIVLSTNTTLNFLNFPAAGDLQRWVGTYSAGTIVVPPGGWKGVSIEAQFIKSGMTGEWYVQIDGVSLGVRKLQDYNNNSLVLESLNAGQTIKLVVLSSSVTQSTQLNQPTDWFSVMASR